MTGRWPGLPLCALLLIVASPTAYAGDAESSAKAKLQTVQHDIAAGKSSQTALKKQQAALAAEIAKDQQDSVDLARSEQTLERDLAGLQRQTEDLARQDARQRADLLTHQKRESLLLAALQRIAIEPPAALVFSPGAPVDSLRSAMLIGAIQPRLAAEADALAAALKALAATRAELDRQHDAILADQDHLDRQRVALRALLDRRRAAERGLESQSDRQQRQLAALAARAGNLQDLIAEAEKARAEAEAAERARAEAAAKAAAEAEAEARRQAAAEAQSQANAPPARTSSGAGDIDLVSNGKAAAPDSRYGRVFVPGRTMLIPPVSGRVTTRFGAKDGFVPARGLFIAAGSGATVVSPFDGVVLFSGPFKGYGEILIIDHGGGYASLLARLDHRDAEVGQHVVAGEPIGRMAVGAGTTAFYMEIRHNNQPIDPLPLLQHG